MSEQGQLGPHLDAHPDADQLSAFAEAALPAHEREAVLLHLAACADCREVLSLALPALPEALLPQPLPVRRSWFANWRLLLPTGALVAAVALVVTVYPRHAPPPSVATNAGVTDGAIVSAGLAAAPLPDAPLSASAPPPGPAAAKPAPPKLASAQLGAPPPGVGEAGPRPGAFPLGQVAQSPLPQLSQSHGQGVPFLPQTAVASAPRDRKFAPPTESARSNEPVGGSQLDGAQAPGGSAQTFPAQKPQAAMTAPAPPPQQAAPPSPAAATASSQTVTVEANAMSVAVTNAAVMKKKRSEPALLPSKLPIASTAAKDHLWTVAIDTAGTLYRSTDEGHRWKLVHAPWTGQAVSVALVGEATLQLVTASGEHWVSVDGKSWTRADGVK